MSVDLDQRRYSTCPICSAARLQLWRIKEGNGQRYRLDSCESCGFVFVNPRPSLGFIMDHYSNIGIRSAGVGGPPNLHAVLAQEHDFPNTRLDAKRIVSTIRSLLNGDLGSRFLDVGCGYGFFSQEALRCGFQVSAIEMAEHERKIASELTGVSPCACSFEEYGSDPGVFQAILMSQTLEHALDIGLWVGKAYQLLARDGVLAVAVPNFDSLFRLVMQENEPFICPPEHLNFFGHRNLHGLLEGFGFRIEETQYVSRLPVTAFAKRLPKIGRSLFPTICSISNVGLKVLDYFGYGQFITVYARKI